MAGRCDGSGLGVSASKCNLTVDRSKVEHNAAGGITISNMSTYSVTNTFIFLNAAGTFGVGLSIADGSPRWQPRP